jgi:hypothetical protein
LIAIVIANGILKSLIDLKNQKGKLCDALESRLKERAVV